MVLIFFYFSCNFCTVHFWKHIVVFLCDYIPSFFSLRYLFLTCHPAAWFPYLCVPGWVAASGCCTEAGVSEANDDNVITICRLLSLS